MSTIKTPPPSSGIGIDPSLTNQAPARPVTLSTTDLANLDTKLSPKNLDIPSAAFSNSGVTGAKADTTFASRANNETKAETAGEVKKTWCGKDGCTSC